MLNGQEVEIAPGRNVIQSAGDQDVHIPHYCYHPGLSAPANCRMCLVEIEMGGRRGMMPACTTMPAEGMIVDTETEAVKQGQRATMEFLLINHPLDCPVCDQAGECELQDYSYTYGPDHSRFHEQKAIQPKKDVGEHIMLYSDRCIRCTRCIRFCDEVSGTSELGYFNRGVHNEIDILPGTRLDNRLSGNTVDICPVGALLDKEFLFKQRVWFLQSADTICPGCSTGCNIRIDTNKERIYRLVPRENTEVNDWWMCDDGRHGWGYVHDEDRLLFPTIGRGTEENLSLWDAAVGHAKDRLDAIVSEHGSQAVAGFVSTHLTNEEQFLFAKLFTDGLGGGRLATIDSVSASGDTTFKSGFTIRADKSPNTRGAQEVLKALGAPVVPASEIWDGIGSGQIKAVIVAGGGPESPFSEGERQSLAGVEFLLVQDVLRSETTDAADVVLPGATFIEKDGTFTNHAGRVQRLNAGLAPPGDARPDWQILRDLANAAGCEFTFETSDAVMAQVAQSVSAFDGISHAAAGRGGIRIEAAD